MAFSTNFRSWRTVAMATLLTGSMGEPEAGLSAEPKKAEKADIDNRIENWLKIKQKIR